MDFSVTVLHKTFKFEMCMPKTQMEGRVSQIFFIKVLVFILLNVEIYVEKNKEKVPVF